MASPRRNIKLIIGLGNPGEKHLTSRSNIGFKIIDILASNHDIEIKTKKKKSLIGQGLFEGKEVILLKPQTFADICGEAALYIASFLRINPRNIVVILDDFTLKLGKLVVEQNGDTSPHPAIANLRDALKSNDFIRVRVGIRGEKVGSANREDYIKQEFEPMESLKLIDIINDTDAVIRSIVHGDTQEVIEKYSL